MFSLLITTGTQINPDETRSYGLFCDSPWEGYSVIFLTAERVTDPSDSLDCFKPLSTEDPTQIEDNLLASVQTQWRHEDKGCLFVNGQPGSHDDDDDGDDDDDDDDDDDCYRNVEK